MQKTAAHFAHAAYLPVMTLAQGGMGKVELVLRVRGPLRRLCARKRPHPHLFADAPSRELFANEARLAGLIHHPHVVPVIDFGEDEEGPFLVMEYIDGVSLAALLEASAAAGETLPLAVALTITLHVARGLQAAHERKADDGTPLQLVHRDVSPRNVLIGRDGLCRVTDFGIAKAFGARAQTATGVLRGNVGYLAPERLRFEPFDRRADLFALGVILYEAVTGARAYDGDEERAAGRILREPPPDMAELRPNTPAEIVQLSFELLAKDPTLRPQTAGEVADRLEAFLSDARLELDRVDLGAYVERVCRDVLAARDRAVAAALATQDEAARADERRWRRWGFAAAGVAALGLGLGLWHTSSEPRHGLTGVYFDDPALTTPLLTRVDPTIAFDWTDASPDPRVAHGTFSVRWTGRLLPERAGRRRLCLRSDDRARLWLDGALVIDDWLSHAPRTTCTTAFLSGDPRGHTLRIEYMQEWREAIIELLWSDVVDGDAASAPVAATPSERLSPR